MKKYKRMCMKTMLVLGAFGLFGCSFEGSQYSPEQVIHNALEEPDSFGSYYAEAELVVREKGEDVEHSIMREWRADNGKTKIETENKDGNDKVIAINDGELLILYEVDKNQASMIDDPELLNLNMPSPKEQANQLLKMVENTHELSIEDEDEKIAGRKTYKLLAKAKEKTTLIGDLELWIDKENWMVLKTIVSVGDTKSEMNYTEISFDQVFEDDLFVLDMPEDVELQNLGDLLETTEVSLGDVVNDLGTPFLYFPEVDEVEITTIEKNQLQGELERTEFNINYTKNESPFLTLTVFEAAKDMAGDIELEMPGSTPIEIRGNEGMQIESGDFRLLSWQEDGISYSIILYDLDVTLEELLKLTTEMEFND